MTTPPGTRPGSSGRTPALLVAAAAALAGGCGDQPRPPPASSDSRAGDWVVVGHRAPGVSAMTDAEAAAWRGHALRLGTGAAISGADTCRPAAYRQAVVPADSFLAAQYHLRGADLGLQTAPDARLEVTEVTCPERPWGTMGGVVLWTAPDHGFAVWDGVFFELRRAGAGG